MLLSKEEHILKKIIVKSGIICLRTDDIITFNPNLSIKEVKIEHFLENIEVYKTLTKNGKKPFLTDNRPTIEFTSEQKRLMKEELSLYFSKVAVITKGDLNKFIFNSFMYLYRPNVPVKSFVKIDKAISWLNMA